VTKLEERKFYVYEWYLKSTNEVFHVGKGSGNRYKERKAHRNEYFQNVLRKHGEDVDVRIVRANLTEQEAWNKERELIAYYKNIGQCKTNLHEGGCGGNTGNYNNPERSRKISEALKRRKPKKGADNPNYGKHLTLETKIKLSKALKGRKLSKEHKEKIGVASKRNWTPEMEVKIQQARQEKLNTMTKEEKFKMVEHLCKFEYHIYFENKLVYADIGYEKMIAYCKEHYQISRTIIEKIISNNWKPTFQKHEWLKTLKILKVERCID